MTKSILVLVSMALMPHAALAQQTLRGCASVSVDSAASAGTAEFVVTLLGTIMARPVRPVTEEDRILVRVLADNQVAPMLSVQRTSTARRPGEVRIIGAPESGRAAETSDRVYAAATLPTCSVDAVLGDFAPGLGEVDITLVTNANSAITRTTLGSFDFAVAPVYGGMFSLGPAVTSLADPAFGVATNSAGHSYVARTDSGRNRIVYALIYTPFVFGKRVAEPPLTREPRTWLKRINPMFGVVLNDIRTNVLTGVSIDLPFGFVANGGWHVGRTSRLDPRSGLSEGAEFPAGGTIPVVRSWQHDWFWAVSLDLRVALKLLGVAGSTKLP